MIYFFIFTSKLTETEALICRYVDADSWRYSYKDMLQNYASNLQKRLSAGTFLHKFNAFSFHYTTDSAALFLTYLTTKEYYRLLKFLNDTLVHMQPEVLNIRTFKMLKTKF